MRFPEIKALSICFLPHQTTRIFAETEPNNANSC
jgi:hypothetical protein